MFLGREIIFKIRTDEGEITCKVSENNLSEPDCKINLLL
jgi:hypothetical protein